jgi:inner membrane transporter RhtA
VRGEPVQDRLQVVDGPQVELHEVAILAGNAASARPGLLDRLPPPSFFLVSAVFHYLGPSFAVLLFARVSVLGVAWLRIVAAAVVFAAWRRPWRAALRLDRAGRWVLVQLGGVLAAMNALFYLAVGRLLLLAGLGVGVCSSVIPYVTDQLAMARLPRATFAMMLALLPVFATLTGAVILGQVPTVQDAAGIGLVVAGLALHRGTAEPGTAGTPPGK